MRRTIAQALDINSDRDVHSRHQRPHVIALDVLQWHAPIGVRKPLMPRNTQSGHKVFKRAVDDAEVIPKENNTFSISLVERYAIFKRVHHAPQENTVD